MRIARVCVPKRLGKAPVSWMVWGLPAGEVFDLIWRVAMWGVVLYMLLATVLP